MVVAATVNPVFGGFVPGFLAIEQIIVSGLAIHVRLMAMGRSAACPLCARSSERLHSRYFRKLGDVPWCGSVVRLRVKARRFFCDNPECAQRTFVESLSGFAQRHGRTTHRLQQAHCQIGFALGGEAGARLAAQLAMPTSPDTLLRRVRQARLPVPPPVRVLGVDDWAIRKGRRYGTILCDLERRRLVDLLPDRSAKALHEWLQMHPEVEIISRDRGDDYIKGASEGAPQAVQVADRWHLLKNLREALERLVDRYHGKVREAAHAAISLVKCSKVVGGQAKPLSASNSHSVVTKSQQRQQQRRTRRLALFEQVRELDRQGVSHRAIAQKVGIHRSTVRRFVRADSFPERASGPRYRKVAVWNKYLRRRWDEGCRNAARLTEELRHQGFHGSYYMVVRQLAMWRCAEAVAGEAEGGGKNRARISPRPSARTVSWLLLKNEELLQADERSLVEEISKQCPTVRNAVALARDFIAMVNDRRVHDWADWKSRARDPTMPVELRTFARGLEADETAVRAALSTEWSNGQVEGQVNRLKMIKRQMYGRANFDLLRQRVLSAA
jgi:transposase